jgi:predicted O-methyltransferase YrrM
MTFADLGRKYLEAGDRYQAALGDFIRTFKPGVVVETGLGVSTLFILAAMDSNGTGQLYSVDPQPWFPNAIVHPRLEWIPKKSVDALGELYARSGWWDLFLHDGNHEVEAQTFDLEFGFAALRQGGWLWCDDAVWNDHRTWAKFIARHDLQEKIVGSAATVQKPADARWIHRYEGERVAAEVREFARAERQSYHGPVHPAFPGS